jgi:hypothetical protein
MKKLGILVMKICAFWLILLPQLVRADMVEMADDEMQNQAIGMGSAQVTPGLPTESDIQSKGDDELEITEKDKLNGHVRSTFESELFAEESEPDVNQLYHREYRIPYFIRAWSGRTSSYKAPEFDIRQHDTAPNPNTP